MPRNESLGVEEDILVLGFTTRLLMSSLDEEVIVERAAESLGDFGRSAHVGIFLFEPDGSLVCAGGLAERRFIKHPLGVALEMASPDLVETGPSPRYLPLDFRQGIPVPSTQGGVPGRLCLCAPLIAANNRLVGMVTLDYQADNKLPPRMMPSLLLLLSMVAIAIDTARLFQQALYDGLTGLFIRRYFDLRLAEEERRLRRFGGRLALLLMDIDHFKAVNDRYGHQQGDAVLRAVADIVKASVRDILDAPCRYGGEEFVVIMPDTDLPGALVVAERIRQAVEGHVMRGPEGVFHVTLSGGVAVMDSRNETTAMSLIEKADQALYEGKKNGRNQIRFPET